MTERQSTNRSNGPVARPAISHEEIKQGLARARQLRAEAYWDVASRLAKALTRRRRPGRSARQLPVLR